MKGNISGNIFTEKVSWIFFCSSFQFQFESISIYINVNIVMYNGRWWSHIIYSSFYIVWWVGVANDLVFYFILFFFLKSKFKFFFLIDTSSNFFLFLWKKILPVFCPHHYYGDGQNGKYDKDIESSSSSSVKQTNNKKKSWFMMTTIFLFDNAWVCMCDWYRSINR